MDMFYILLIILLMNSCNTNDTQQKLSSQKLQRKKSFVALVFNNNSNTYISINNHNKNKKTSCKWLEKLKHQNKLCMKRKGLSEILLEAKNLAIHHCKEKFRYEQWNCSTKDIFFRKIYRETALMYSMVSSALMFCIARACADGKLAGCKCAEHGKSENTRKWEWGGCGDNIKYAKKFTKKFLQIKKKGDDPNAILRYNSEVGIKITLKNEEKVCRCHGVSGSCVVRICWKKVKPFKIISEELRKLYHNALQVESKNNIRSLPIISKKSQKLIFLEKSPSFCSETVGRQCENADSCATLCCGRGFYNRLIEVVERCNCRWRTPKTYEVQCEKCHKNITELRCK